MQITSPTKPPVSFKIAGNQVTFYANITKGTEIDGSTGQEITLWTYDQYSLPVRVAANTAAQIAENYDAWLQRAIDYERAQQEEKIKEHRDKLMTAAAVRSAQITLQNEITAGTRTPTQVVACAELLPEWRKEGPAGDGNHPINEACTYNGQPWRCCQAHNTANNPDIRPGSHPTQWAPYHTTDPGRALPYVQPTGAHDSYLQGECCRFNGKVYRSVMETANAYSPADYLLGWEIVNDSRR